ncbi:MAG: protein adenylyltransferase SelO [Notoacmeibacter sp.]
MQAPEMLKDRFRPSLLAGEGFSVEIASEMVGIAPRLVHASPLAAQIIGLNDKEISLPDFVDFFSGKTHPKSLTASVYSGHQFGSYVPQLGDGRALSYGVIEGLNGPIEVQLKGAGKTPFSRFGDGRAVMRSSIREYLCSEAMAALGIPTTRALSIIGTGERVFREMMEPGAVVARLAPCFIRFGHFEYFAHTGQPEKLRELVDLVIANFFPDIIAQDYAAFFRAVCERTAKLMAMWQAAGFSHGVMNTDNMSILGLTIDYGPFGFMDAYEPMFICNHTDHAGRYAFARQPSVGLWNCQALAAALAGLIDSADLEAGLKAYEPAYQNAALPMMRAKFGLTGPDNDKLIPEAFQLIALAKADFTQSFRRLSNLDQDDASFLIADFGAQGAAFKEWLQRWQSVEPDFAAMRGVNPNFVLRNWVAETAIRSVEDKGELSTIDSIFACVTNPYEDRANHPDAVRFSGPPPETLRGLEVSCSS